MKKVDKKPFICLFVLVCILALCIFGLTGGTTAQAETSAVYRYEVTKYDVTYDIGSNCSIAVTEDITINYLGTQSTGFIRDIPTNGGAQVHNVEVSKMVDGVASDVYYDVYIEDSNFISVDIGDYTNKYNQEESYRITYTYNLTNSVVKKNLLSVNPIGYGWDCVISNATVTLILPDGYKSALYYIGATTETSDEFDDSGRTDDNRVIITASVTQLSKYNGVTFDITFEDGALSNYFDFTPYWFVIIGAVILLALILLKVFVFSKSALTPVVNYEAPNKMDPLIMGKLIDNKVNSEDVTSLIYYWASKGYLKINLDDNDDPTIIRIVRNLPATSAGYEQIMFDGLFARGDTVKPSQLKGSFYKVVEKVTAQVNAQAKGLYDSKSIGLSIIFAIIGGLLLGFAPLVLTLLQIWSGYIYLPAFIALIPALLIYAATETVMYYRLKLKKNKKVLFTLGIMLLCLVFTLLYTLLIPSSIIGIIPKILLCLISCAIITCSVLLINRTKEYTEKLNDIVGFRNFILLAEKDQLEMMLEQDPQFYYNVLPYAQVLGVSDKWEEKFADITVEPPRWMTGNAMTTVIEFHIMNTMIRNSFGRMSSNMISRPSSSGLSGGGHGGGFGGGFGGGGFGGGGGRGR